MNTQTKVTLAEYKKKMGGYVGLLYYRYCNVCVKAEPASLLSTEIVSEDGLEKIEDVARVTPGDDERTLLLYPFDNNKIKPLMQGLLREHPEFKLKVLRCDTDEVAEFPDDMDKDLYLSLTVPEVDGNRRKAMRDLVNTLYHEAEGNVESNSTTYSTRITSLAKDEEKEDVDALKKELDDIHSMHKDKIDNLREKKLQEIENAYELFAKKHSKAEQEYEGGNGSIGKQKAEDKSASADVATDKASQEDIVDSSYSLKL